MVKIIKNNVIPTIQDNVSCIGYFDGVHLGHQELIKRTVKLADKLGLVPTLICFDPDPIDVINNKITKHIISYKNRIKTIEYYGIKQIIVIKFNRNIMNLSPKSFIDNYLNKMNIRHLVCGFDFSFGYKGLGNVELLKKYCKFDLSVVPELKYYDRKISSTNIKENIVKGNFKRVNRELGYNYYIEVKVEKCSKKGSKWLIEANLVDDECILPSDGIYSCNIEINNNKIYMTSPIKINVGRIILTDIYEY